MNKPHNPTPKHPIHGWLNLYKPVGITSAKAVAIVKRQLGVKKIGHTGTLDPLASGVLPLALGEATKLTRFLFDASKAYRFSVTFGAATDTQDAEGTIIETSDVIPTSAQIEGVISHFIGNIEQVPSKFSAIKVDGQRAYKRARLGQDVVMPSRMVVIEELLFHGFEDSDPKTASFTVTCGKGTYVRSLGEMIARKLGTVGFISKLERIKVGKFCIDHAILLESLENIVYKDANLRHIMPIEVVLDDIPVLDFTSDETKKLFYGQCVEKLHGHEIGSLLGCSFNGRLFGLAEAMQHSVKPTRLLCVLDDQFTF